MTNSYRISEAADLIGVPATTLRYYEDIGLAGKPARTSNGYRAYDDADVAAAKACGGDCPCATAAVDVELHPRPVALDPSDAERHPAAVQLQEPSARPATDVAIACSLEPDALHERLAAWRAVAAFAERREAVEGGEALYFPADPSLAAEVASLAAAEQQCCAFFTFDLRISTGGIRLMVLAPDEARGLVTQLLSA